MKLLVNRSNTFEPLGMTVFCINWLQILKGKCHNFVKLLKLKLKVFTSITSCLLYFKSIVVIYKAKMIKAVSLSKHFWTKLYDLMSLKLIQCVDESICSSPQVKLTISELQLIKKKNPFSCSNIISVCPFKFSSQFFLVIIRLSRLNRMMMKPVCLGSRQRPLCS